jgi:hypothetical protein
MSVFRGGLPGILDGFLRLDGEFVQPHGLCLSGACKYKNLPIYSTRVLDFQES